MRIKILENKSMKIKVNRIYIFKESEHDSYTDCCQFLKTCKINFVSYPALDNDDNRIYCIELDGQ